jgi:signal transduction histidine kinase
LILNTLKIFFAQIFTPNTTDIYVRKSRWKWYLAVVGLVIIAASTIYTHLLVEKLQKQEQKRVDIFRRANDIMTSVDVEILNDEERMPQSVWALITSINLDTLDIPIIWTDEKFNVIDARYYSGLKDDVFDMQRDSAYIYGKLNKLILEKREPILLKDDVGQIIGKLYYDDSNLQTLLKYYPVFQFILIGLFIAFGYLGFSASRRNEQNRVWVGMAKETAHQLGTPIAAIMGWIEHLRATHEDDEMTQEVVNELENDVNRLSLVADRFSKIGSEPELVEANIYEALDRCRSYMAKRAPRKVVFDFPMLEVPPQYLGVKLNNHLFDWVVENLMRNALDAMEDGQGTIAATVNDEGAWVSIDISDTGKGIPTNKFKTVFQPGFTTKKRGWGLGLSLAKRIIENYHGGKIFVKDSMVGKFTIFTIRLPKA